MDSKKSNQSTLNWNIVIGEEISSHPSFNTPKKTSSHELHTTQHQNNKFINMQIQSPLPKLQIKTEMGSSGCNCRKSKCLKMYCVCFAKGSMCTEACLCDSCKNKNDNMQRSIAIDEVITRDPFAFSKNDDKNLVMEASCNCRKSGCRKKYCDCFRKGRRCGERCLCVQCKNRDPVMQMIERSVEGSKKVKIG